MLKSGNGVLTVSSMAMAGIASCPYLIGASQRSAQAPSGRVVGGGPAPASPDRLSRENAQRMIQQGGRIFRGYTFGSEGSGAMARENNGSIGGGISPMGRPVSRMEG